MKRNIRSISFAILGVIGCASAGMTQSAAQTISLKEAVQLAIKNSAGLAQSQAALESARARVDEVESYAMPQLAGDATYTRIDPVVSISIPGAGGKTTTFSTMPNNNYNALLSLQQPIWAFRRFSSEDRVAESGVKSAEDNLDSYRAQAAYQTTQVYYAILTTDEGLRVEQDQLKVLKENLGVTEERQKQGTATSLDPLSVRVRISGIQSQIADLNSTRAKQEAMLRRLTGLAPGTHVAVSRPVLEAPLPENVDSLMTIAQKQRPEIMMARDAENTARLQIDAAKASNDPLLAASVTGGVKDGYLPNLTDPKLNWTGSVNLHIPILDGGRVHAQVDQAEANYRAAQSRSADALRGVQSDVEQALDDVLANRERLALTADQIQQAQQAYDVANVRYKNGAATNLDVLTAQSALEQANLQHAQLTYALELSQYNLNRAVGTALW